MTISKFNLTKRIKNKFNQFRNRKIASPIEVERAEQIFYISYLREGMTVFDVGANIGELSLLFSRFVGTSGQIYAFEASETTFTKLTTICGTAKRSQIHLHHCAVADVEGILQLHTYDEHHSGWNSLANRPLETYGIDIKPTHIENIRSITLDTYCEKHQIDHINLLKIDVEGAEYQVMLGAKSLFKSKSIDCCIFEFGQTTFDMGNTPAQIENFLAKSGYKIKNIVTGNPTFPGGSDSSSAQFSLHIATPKR